MSSVTTLILPGLFDSGPDHWQSHWERADATCRRVEQADWAAPSPRTCAKDRLIHARSTRGPTVLMASDIMPGMQYQRGNDVWLNLLCESVEEVDSLYAALADGGRGTMPPHDAFRGARFAMLTDRFGVNWMLDHERPRQGD